MADIIARPLLTTVGRYQRLKLSRRRGNAVRQSLLATGLIERVTIATRCGQTVLYQLTERGRTAASSLGVDPGPKPRESLEHMFWVHRVAQDLARKGYGIKCEHPIKGNGAIDVLAEKPGERMAIEVETGKSDTLENLSKIAHAGFDRVVLVATSPTAVVTCQKAIAIAPKGGGATVELLTWLDVS